VSRKWLFAFACVWLVDCGAPPWQLGRPLDGRPSIPPGHALPTRAQAVAAAEQARVDGRPVLEIDALSKLDAAERMTGSEAGRLAELLVARAAEFRGLRRGIPESADLEAVARLDPAQAALLGPARAAAAKAAADAWAAIGAREEAAAAFRLATAVKGVRPDGWIIPRRTAVPPFEGTPTAPAAVEAYVYGGASLSARLLPLVAAFPWLLDHQTRALAWAELLLAEDPTSPDVLELVAVIWGRAGRFGGTERMLMELAYYTPDRPAGLARGAAVWERVGRPREACAQWIRAARWRDEPEDPLWRRALACARNDPGAGDAKAIRDYVVSRARPERREAIEAELDGRPPPAAGADGGVAPASDGGAPADGGGQ